MRVQGAADGRVEIAYFTFPDHEGQGVASAMAGELVRIAFGGRGVDRVLAHSLLEENDSRQFPKVSPRSISL